MNGPYYYISTIYVTSSFYMTKKLSYGDFVFALSDRYVRGLNLTTKKAIVVAKEKYA